MQVSVIVKLHQLKDIFIQLKCLNSGMHTFEHTVEYTCIVILSCVIT